MSKFISPETSIAATANDTPTEEHFSVSFRFDFMAAPVLHPVLEHFDILCVKPFYFRFLFYRFDDFTLIHALKISTFNKKIASEIEIKPSWKEIEIKTSARTVISFYF